MSTPTPTPGASPLVEHLPSNITEIRIMPGFGSRLQLVYCGTEGMPEPMQGAVSAVTVYGDGRIEYHPEPVEQPAAPEPAHLAPCRWPSSPACTCGGAA
jgi:hypothetical protein